GVDGQDRRLRRDRSDRDELDAAARDARGPAVARESLVAALCSVRAQRLASGRRFHTALVCRQVISTNRSVALLAIQALARRARPEPTTALPGPPLRSTTPPRDCSLPWPRAPRETTSNARSMHSRRASRRATTRRPFTPIAIKHSTRWRACAR